MRFFASLFLYLLVSYSVFAQTDKRFKGQVYMHGSDELIPFATLRIKHTYLGSISEEDGSFAIKIPYAYRNDTLVFSCIGYEPKEVPISSLREQEENRVFLKIHIQELADVVVSRGRQKNPKRVLKKALNRIKVNYPKGQFIYDAYYRERIEENGATIKFSDASVTYSQTGYTGKRFRQSIYGGVLLSNSRVGTIGGIPSFRSLYSHWGERLHDHFGHRTAREDKVKIHDSRSSLNLTKEGLEANIEGGPLGIVSKDLVKYIHYFLDKKSFKSYQYELFEEYLENKGWTYLIRFEPKKEPASLKTIQDKKAKGKRTSRSDILSGEIYIDQDSYAIVKLAYRVEQDYRRHICNLGDMNIQHYGYEVNVDYKRNLDSRWQVDRIFRKDEFIFKDTVSQQTTPYATIAEMYVTESNSAIQSILPTESFLNHDANSLYDYAVEYNPEFWKTYERTNPIAAIDSEIRSHMEMTDSLEKQFAIKHMRDESLKPPVAEVIPTQITLHGKNLVDNYSWLKDRNPKSNSKIMDYIKAENVYTDNYLIPLRKNIRELSNEIFNKMDVESKTDSVLDYGYWYWSLFEGYNDHRTIYRRKNESGAPKEVLLNLTSIADSADYFQFGFYDVSPNNQYLAYAIDTVGSGSLTTYITDLTSGEVLQDSSSNNSDFMWSEDSKGFFYSSKDKSTNRKHSILYHRIGDQFSQDTTFFHEPDPARNVAIWKSFNKEYLFVSSRSATSRDLYMARNKVPYDFKLISATKGREVHSISPVEDKMYVFTNQNAPNGKLMVADTTSFSIKHLIDVEEPAEGVVLEDYAVFRNFFVFLKREQMHQYIEVRNRFTGDKYRIESDHDKLRTYALGRNINIDTDTLRYFETAPNYSTQRVLFNMNNKKSKSETVSKRKGYDLSSFFRVKLLWIQARDGAQIPVSIVYFGSDKMKNLENRPVFIDAYGAYGLGNRLTHNASIEPLIEEGFIYAYVHVRGGDELGDDWYEQGKQFNKMNSFYDLIDAVDFMKYTGIGHSQRFFANGGSAGGLLMAAVINERPEMFAGAFLDVPFLDVINTMLDESLPLTVDEFDEWGNPRRKKDFNYMLQYSPYENIKPQAYPKLMFQIGLEDKNVGFWEATKMVAKLRATKTDDNVLLLQTKLSEGHSLSSSRMQGVQALAQKYSVLFEWLREVNYEIAKEQEQQKKRP